MVFSKYRNWGQTLNEVWNICFMCVTAGTDGSLYTDLKYIFLAESINHSYIQMDIGRYIVLRTTCATNQPYNIHIYKHNTYFKKCVKHDHFVTFIQFRYYYRNLNNTTYKGGSPRTCWVFGIASYQKKTSATLKMEYLLNYS